ncbi:MAG TPA: hypothetical protein VFA43_24060 [Gemmatimonadaceae bacterium]|nr:hypothetical protein [Gemmatimonadaceae bacterium]
MDVIYEHVAPTDVDPAEVQAAVSALERIAPTPAAARLVITGDFVASNRTRLSLEDAAQYQTDRTFGVAAARTLPLADGTVDVVVSAPLLHSNVAAEIGLERLVSHEAHHVAIHQRGETQGTIRARHGIPGMSHRGYFSAVAGMVVDEYRVEKALCDAGDWPHHGYRSSLPETLGTFQADLLDACILRHPNEDIGRTCQSVLTSFSHIATLGGYVAAEYLASDGRLAPDTTLPLWQRFVGSAWDPFVATLRDVPSARDAISLRELDALTFGMIAPLDGWLRQVGFEIRDLDEGFYFDVLRLPDE